MVHVKDYWNFLTAVLNYIHQQDKVHYSTIMGRMVKFDNDPYFEHLLAKIFDMFTRMGRTPLTVAQDYLKMINDMRSQMKYFEKHGEYSCNSEEKMIDLVYSNKEVMESYMSALLISQILWEHHFRMIKYFVENLTHLVFMKDAQILEIGAGHGLYSSIVRSEYTFEKHIDIYDIHEEALGVTRKFIGDAKISYSTTIESAKKYDLIIIGEVLEHLQYPKAMLKAIRSQLKEHGVVWITVPTNAPAIDHIYLFRHSEDVTSLIMNAGFDILDCIQYNAEGNTNLIGVMAKSNGKPEYQSDRIEQFKQVQQQGLDLFTRKNADYGDAFAEYGTVGILMRMQDKIRRYLSVSSRGIALVNDEGLRDTLIDMANYSTMALMLMDEEKSNEVR